MTWEAFRDYYTTNAMPALALSSQARATINVFERECNPQKLASVTTAKITGIATKLRKNG